MASYYYSCEVPLPLVDHIHERTHQHQTFLQYLAHRKFRPEDHPNRPDLDIRDAFTEYLIEVEVPGVKNASEISVTWTNSREILIIGDSGERPDEPSNNTVGSELLQQRSTETRDSNGDWKAPAEPQIPILLVGERRIGPFRRFIHLPEQSNMEKLEAKLEDGLLKIRVPKIGLKPAKSGKVNVHK